MLAWQQQTGSTQSMVWEHRDLSNASVKVAGAGADGNAEAELEPMGSDAGSSAAPVGIEPDLPMEYEPYPGFSDAQRTQYMVDGVPVPFEVARQLIGAGAATIDARSSSSGVTRQFAPLPIYTQFCGGLEGDPISAMDCSNEITAYTGLTSVGDNALFDHGTPQQPTIDEKEIRAGVDTLLKKCEGFVNSVLAKLRQLHSANPPASTSIRDLLGKVKIAYIPGRNKPSTVSGSMEGGDATVLIGWNSNHILPRTTIHEILHLSKGSGSDPWYNDYEVAEAIQKVLIDAFNNYKPDDPKNPSSGWIDARLRQRCE